MRWSCGHLTPLKRALLVPITPNEEVFWAVKYGLQGGWAHTDPPPSQPTKRDIIYLEPVISLVASPNHPAGMHHVIRQNQPDKQDVCTFSGRFSVFYVITEATLQLWRLLDGLRHLSATHLHTFIHHPPITFKTNIKRDLFWKDRVIYIRKGCILQQLTFRSITIN